MLKYVFFVLIGVSAVYASDGVRWENSEAFNVNRVGTIDTYDGTIQKNVKTLKPMLIEADFDKPLEITWYENGKRRYIKTNGEVDTGDITYATSFLIRKKFNNEKTSPDLIEFK